MAKILASVTEVFDLNTLITKETRFEWSVALFAVGVGIYFALPFEPSLWRLGLTFIGGLGLYQGLKTQNIRGTISLLIAGLMLAGLLRATWHTGAASAPILPKYERAYMVTGWIKSVEISGPRLRWQIKVSHIEGLTPEKTPKYIRTTVSPGAFKPGDSISIRAILSAPPGPVIPGGYNPARRAYFNQIGGYGFSIGKPTIANIGTLSSSDEVARAVVRVRYGLADRILAAAPSDTAGLQVALLTGIRTYITEVQTDALRAAGLAHVLAISGLHMGLVAGSTFYVMTLMLACILPLSRRMDVRKPAAVIGAIAATAYLVLSGASVATQRAYIMAIIVFLAVILDRRAFSMRSVALAAAITLLWHPEALVSAGFQMSFSAVAALVVVYRSWDARRGAGTYQAGWFARMRASFMSLSITSLVAGFATSGFAVLHFNRMANYGFAGNLLAMPIFTFWIMPSAMLVFLSLPFGLEAYPLALMGLGIDLLLEIATWVAGWTGAVIHLPAAPAAVIGFYGLGFLCLCLGPKLIRYIGLMIIFICLGFWIRTPIPDMRISDAGAVAIWSETAQNTLIVERKNKDRYGREQFMRRSGVSQSTFKTYGSPEALCDALACRMQIKGYTLSVTTHPSEVAEECAETDLVILTRRRAGPVAQRHCDAVLIDADMLYREGARNIYFTPTRIRSTQAITPALKRRPWGESQ